MSKRIYTVEEGRSLVGKMVCCDEKGCDGKMCGGHNKPHQYDDEECFSSCYWPGHDGMCVEVK